MGAFFVRPDFEGKERCRLDVSGKRDKTRVLHATAEPELMVELAGDQRENGWSPFPIAGEAPSLLLPIDD